MRTADSSIVVAAFASWHERHQPANEAVSEGIRPIAHALLETYSVLTRLPAPHRAEPGVVVEFLERAFTESPLVLSDRALAALPGRLAGLGISGGASYDALVALSAADAEATLLTCDARAAATYRRCGVEFELIG